RQRGFERVVGVGRERERGQGGRVVVRLDHGGHTPLAGSQRQPRQLHMPPITLYAAPAHRSAWWMWRRRRTCPAGVHSAIVLFERSIAERRPDARQRINTQRSNAR